MTAAISSPILSAEKWRVQLLWLYTGTDAVNFVIETSDNNSSWSKPPSTVEQSTIIKQNNFYTKDLLYTNNVIPYYFRVKVMNANNQLIKTLGPYYPDRYPIAYPITLDL